MLCLVIMYMAIGCFSLNLYRSILETGWPLNHFPPLSSLPRLSPSLPLVVVEQTSYGCHCSTLPIPKGTTCAGEPNHLVSSHNAPEMHYVNGRKTARVQALRPVTSDHFVTSNLHHLTHVLPSKLPTALVHHNNHQGGSSDLLTFRVLKLRLPISSDPLQILLNKYTVFHFRELRKFQASKQGLQPCPYHRGIEFPLPRTSKIFKTKPETG